MFGTSLKHVGLAVLGVAVVPFLVFGLQADSKPVDASTPRSPTFAKMIDLEGVVSVQGLGQSRGTIVVPGMELRQGSWVRTGTEGATAARLRLGNDVLVTLGPATQVELVSAKRIRVSNGVIAVRLRNNDSQLTLLGASEQQPTIVKGKSLQVFVVSANGNKIQSLKEHPLWLQGFNSTSATDGIGSLVATVGDRKVPLSIAAHRVDVQIRDQIARTTIVETFANHTGSRLEGEFLFPLPANASVSGFAMWIGDELVEADIVEKIRAREIFDTIVSERRDPALLEWTAGNVFKARVFPIEPHSEKRIRIVYTQVLPTKGSSFQYDLSLESEMLRTNPVKQLEINVLVHSGRPIKSIQCPTHAARLQLPESNDQPTHHAQAQFSAQNFSADRDFRLVCELQPTLEAVTPISHQRGDDGYFMLQLSPPHDPGDLREIDATANTDPRRFLILCDTSGSMSKTDRKLQTRFVETLLHSLSPNDQFNLAVCDVDSNWIFKQPMKTTSKTIQRAVRKLIQRDSLGWSDITMSLETALRQSTSTTHVIFLGDGISTAIRDSKQVVTQTLKEIPTAKNAILHTIGLGNSVDDSVLKSISELGAGTMRHLRQLSDAPIAVEELLTDIKSPGWHDLTFEFEGIRVAAVYPRRLPRVAQGTQQLIVGRFLPGDQGTAQGKVTVKGRRGHQSFQISKDLDFRRSNKNGDNVDGNSFVPRLWARHYLDHLLAQGSSTREQVIEMSQRFHIVTPYTSMLVLETQADRDRFGVQRRFEMRDGERFFAEGKRDALYQLKQEQMKKAALWKQQLQLQVASSIRKLGRDQDALAMSGQSYHNMPAAHDRTSRVFLLEAAANDVSDDEWEQQFGFFGRGVGGGGFFGGGGGVGGNLGGGGGGGVGGGFGGGFGGSDNSGQADFSELIDLIQDETNTTWEDAAEGGSISEFEVNLSLVIRQSQSINGEGPQDLVIDLSNSGNSFGGESFGGGGFGGGGFGEPFRDSPNLFGITEDNKHLAMGFLRPSQNVDWVWQGTEWLSNILPAIRQPSAAYARGIGFAFTNYRPWPDEHQSIVDRLSRRSQFAGGGVLIEDESTTLDPRWQRVKQRDKERQLVSTNTWLIKPLVGFSEVEWCSENEFGTYSLAFELGQVREAVEGDRDFPFTGWKDGTLDPISDFTAPPKSVAEKDGRIFVQIDVPSGFGNALATETITIDSDRDVILSIEQKNDGRVSRTTTFSDFVKIAGKWWARQQTIRNTKGRIIGQRKRSIRLLDKKLFAERFKKEVPNTTAGVILKLPFQLLSAARQSEQNGNATFEDQFVLLVNSIGSDNWDQAFSRWKTLKESQPKKRALRWLELCLLHQGTRNLKVHQSLVKLSKEIANNPNRYSSEYFEVISFMLDEISDQEALAILETLAPAASKYSESWGADWARAKLQALTELQRHNEASELFEQITKATPWNLQQQIRYASQIAKRDGPKSATEFLLQHRNRDIEWTQREWGTIQKALIDTTTSESAKLVLVEEWLKKEPTSSTAMAKYFELLEVIDHSGERVSQQVRRWINEGLAAKLNDHRAHARAAASLMWVTNRAVQYAIFEDKKFRSAVAATLVARARHDKSLRYVLTQNRGLRQWPEVQSVLRGWREELQTNAMTLPMGDLQRLTQLTSKSGTPPEWSRIAERIHARWTAEKTPKSIQQVENSLKQIYQRISKRRASQFAIECGERLKKEQRTPSGFGQSGTEHALFEHLLSLAWTQKREDQLFAAISFDSWQTNAAMREYSKLQYIHQAVEHALQSRIQAERQRIRQQAQTQNWTRKQLHAAFKVSQQAVFNDLANRLKLMESKASPLLADWLRLERAFVESKGQKDVNAHYDFCWTLLDKSPSSALSVLNKRLDRRSFNVAAAKLDPKLNQAENSDDLVPSNLFGGPNPFGVTEANDREYEGFDRLLLQRAFLFVLNRAVQKSAPKTARKRVAAYIEAGILDPATTDRRWQLAKTAFLLATNQHTKLEVAIRKWIRESTPTNANAWRLVLAQIVAEQGELQQAISLAETVKNRIGLDETHATLLGDWYLATNQRDSYEDSLVESWRAMNVWQIQTTLTNLAHKAAQSSNPGEFDVPIQPAIQALAEMGQSAAAIELLENLFTQTKHPEILEAVPFAVLGQSELGMYRSVGEIRAKIVNVVEEETPLDHILASVAELRKSDELNSTDLRALQLIEAIIAQRASQVVDQSQPHIERCLNALNVAYSHPWKLGERALTVNALLDDDGLNLHGDSLISDHQIKHMRRLLRAIPAGSEEHLSLSFSLADFLTDRNQYNGRQNFQSDRQAAALVYQSAWEASKPKSNDFENPNRKRLFFAYLDLLTGLGHFSEAEALIDSVAKRDQPRSTKTVLAQQKENVWYVAFRNKGRVSVGEGQELFESLRQRFQQQALADRPTLESVDHFVALCAQAAQLEMDVARPAMRDFIQQHGVAVVLRCSAANERSMLSKLYSGAKQRVSATFAVHFLLDYLEARISRSTIKTPGPLGTYTVAIAQVLKQEPALRPRVLGLTLHDLRRSMIRGGGTTNKFCYNPYNGYFMIDDAAKFSKIMIDVVDRYGKSPLIVNRVATYLFHGLHEYKQAIRVLLNAHKQGVIDTAGVNSLIQFVDQAIQRNVDVSEYKIETLIRSLVDADPLELDYRRHLARALKRARRTKQLETLLDESYSKLGGPDAEHRFDQSENLTDFLAEFGRHQQAIDYLLEEITARKEQPADDPHGDLRSDCLVRLANLYLIDGQTRAAIDAQLEAMKFWNDSELDPVEELFNLLASTKDLPATAQWLMEKSKASGREQPFIRAALGRAFHENDQPNPAVEHLEIALRYLPSNNELREELIDVYDELERWKDKRRHVLLLLEWSRTEDRTSFAHLLSSLPASTLDKRTATNLVELLPDDADAHLQLAELWDQDETRHAAITVAQRATELGPNNREGFFDLVELQVKETQWQAANLTLKRIQKTKWGEEEIDRINMWTRRIERLSNKKATGKSATESPFD